jgi:N utilization substance protein B
MQKIFTFGLTLGHKYSIIILSVTISFTKGSVIMSKHTSNEKREAKRQARQAVFELLYETEYHPEATPEEILALAVEDRDVDAQNPYIQRVYFGIMSHMDELDALIGKHARGWKTNRLSRVSRAVLRLATYEMAYDGTPAPIVINEAVELSKTFDEEKARAFVNGVLNAVKDTLPAEADANA